MTKIERTSYEILETGTYRVKVLSADLVDSQFGGKQVEFVFQVLDERYKDITLKGWTSDKFGAKSKLFQWAQALFGRPIPDSYKELDTDHLVDREALAIIVERAKDDGSVFNRIDGLKPVTSPQLPLPATAANGESTPAANGDTFPPKKEADDIPW